MTLIMCVTCINTPRDELRVKRRWWFNLNYGNPTNAHFTRDSELSNLLPIRHLLQINQMTVTKKPSLL